MMEIKLTMQSYFSFKVPNDDADKENQAVVKYCYADNGNKK